VRFVDENDVSNRQLAPCKRLNRTHLHGCARIRAWIVRSDSAVPSDLPHGLVYQLEPVRDEKYSRVERSR
jgi:hypothetical protein